MYMFTQYIEQGKTEASYCIVDYFLRFIVSKDSSAQ